MGLRFCSGGGYLASARAIAGSSANSISEDLASLLSATRHCCVKAEQQAHYHVLEGASGSNHADRGTSQLTVRLSGKSSITAVGGCVLSVLSNPNNNNDT